MRHALLVCGLVFAATPRLAAEVPAYAVNETPAGAIRGALVIVGGGPMPASIRDEFLRLAGKEAKLVVIPTAAAGAEQVGDRALVSWKSQGIANLAILHTRDRRRANDAEFIKPLADATAVWIDGGDQTRLADAYVGTAVEAELKKLLERGGVVGGTSAGAAIMSRLMIAGGNPTPKVAQGFGLIPNVIIDQHFTERKREPRLRDALGNHPGWVGIGIDEATAVVVRGRKIKVVGRGAVTVCLARSVRQPERIDVLRGGAERDLIALSRAALDRAGPAFPPAKMRKPLLEKGTLVIGGGGGLNDDIYRRFIDAAGGPDGPFIVIPTAMPDPVPSELYDVKRLKKLGVKQARALHTRDRAEAEAPQMIEALRAARGVWLGGGRQWRFVDSYAGTRFEKELHALLARGGAIGGSSAGASIQAEYLCRGDPLGNLNISAEGYERGFAFLPGTAIDQHFFKRKRTRDMSELMKTFPQLLGIGIDEGTAAIVNGHMLEVAGTNNIAVYDGTRPNDSGRDYRLLRPGTRYDLRERRVLE